jgi:ketosteroid isomerase-like protein
VILGRIVSRENLELFWRTVEAFNSGDVEGAVRACHPDVEFLPQRAAIQGPLHGHDGIRAFFADNAESLDLFVTDYDEVRDLGDRMLAFGSIRIRGKGSGLETDIPSALVLEFRDGKLVRLQDYRDRPAALEAAGLTA